MPIHCPHCACLTAEAAAKCARCGGALSGSSQAPGSSRCPSCNGFFGPVSLERVECSMCVRCGGLWLDAKTLETLEHRDDAEATWRELQGRLASQPRPTQGRERVYLPCPDCEKMLRREIYFGNTGVLVDRCRKHGAWLTEDGIGAILEIAAKGIKSERVRVQKGRVEVSTKRTALRKKLNWRRILYNLWRP